MKLARAPLLACWLLGLLPLPAQPHIYVVVAAANPLRTISAKEAQALYMGRSRTFGAGELALAFDLPRDNPVRDAFYQILTGMTPAQVNSYWSRLMFTGQTMPPRMLGTEQLMADLVKRNPSAIGYLSTEPTDSGLRTVLVLRTP